MKNLKDLNKFEINLSFRKNSENLTIDKNQTVNQIKEKVKNLLLLDLREDIDFFIGKFFLSDFMSSISLYKICELFLSNKFEIIYSKENIYNLSNPEFLDKEIKNINFRVLENDFMKSKNILYSLIEKEKKFKFEFNKVDKEFKELDNRSKKILIDEKNNNAPTDEEEDQLKNFRNQIENETANIEEIQQEIDKNVEFIITCKNLEKEGLSIFKENRKLIGNIYNNNLLVEELKEANKKLEEKSKKNFIFIIF